METETTPQTQTPAAPAEKPAQPTAAATPATPAASVTPAPVAGAKPTPVPAPKSDKWKPMLSAQNRYLETADKLKAAEPKAQKLDALLAKVKEDPLGALGELGIDWNTLAMAKVKERERGAAPTPAPSAAAAPAPEVQKLETEIAKVTKRLDETDTARQNAEKQAKDQQWNTFVSTVDTGIRAEATAYPAIIALNATGQVVKEIEEQFSKDKTLLTPAEAAKRVEERLRGELVKLRDQNPALAEILFGKKEEAKATPKEIPGRRTGPRSLSATPSIPVSAVATPAGAPPPAKKEEAQADPAARGRKGGFLDWAQEKGRI